VVFYVIDSYNFKATKGTISA